MTEGKSLVFVVLKTRETTNLVNVKKVSYYTYVMGDTYPFREILKKYLWWNPVLYMWVAEKDVAKQVAEELRNAGATVMEVSRFYPGDYDIVRDRIRELIKRGVINEVLEISKELLAMPDAEVDYLLPIEMEIMYIVNVVRRKYKLNASFDDILKKMLEGQIGEEWGRLAKKRLQKLAKAYVKLKNLGLTDMTVNMICLLSIIYEDEFKKRSKSQGGEA